MKIGPKRVHTARYEIILKLDGALWLTIIFKPLLTPKGTIKSSKNSKKSLKVRAKPAKLFTRFGPLLLSTRGGEIGMYVP